MAPRQHGTVGPGMHWSDALETEPVLSKIERNLANSNPTSTKLDPDDHKEVGKLSLGDHRLKLSQSMENSDLAQEHSFPPKNKIIQILRARVDSR